MKQFCITLDLRGCKSGFGTKIVKKTARKVIKQMIKGFIKDCEADDLKYNLVVDEKDLIVFDFEGADDLKEYHDRKIKDKVELFASRGVKYSMEEVDGV